MREALLWLALTKHEWFSEVNEHHLQQQNEPNHSVSFYQGGGDFHRRLPNVLTLLTPYKGMTLTLGSYDAQKSHPTGKQTTSRMIWDLRLEPRMGIGKNPANTDARVPMLHLQTGPKLLNTAQHPQNIIQCTTLIRLSHSFLQRPQGG